MEEQKDYRQYRNQLCSRKGKKGKVTNSWGIYDIYKFIRKNKWFNIGRPLKEHEFYTIIRSMNKLIAEDLAMGRPFKFPQKMGLLELRKHPCGVRMKNGKLKVTYPIDWAETTKLWYDDEEARKTKTLLRREISWVYYFKYNPFEATYENKCFYKFDMNTFIKKALSKNIKEGKVDTVWATGVKQKGD